MVSTSLGKLFLRGIFSKWEHLFLTETSYQKPFIVSVSMLFFQMFTLKLHLQHKN